MFDKKRFRAFVVLSGLTMQQVAAELGINSSTLYRKINGESDFYREEIQKLCVILNIDNPASVFFTQNLA